MTARLHHYVPRFYLKGFTANGQKNDQLFVVDAKTKRTFVTSSRNVAAERDFLLLDVDGLAPDALETQMANFESGVNAALNRIIQSGSFKNQDDRAHIFSLMALLAVRNPLHRERIEHHQEDKAFSAMEKALSSRESWDTLMREVLGYSKFAAESGAHFLRRGSYF